MSHPCWDAVQPETSSWTSLNDQSEMKPNSTTSQFSANIYFCFKTKGIFAQQCNLIQVHALNENYIKSTVRFSTACYYGGTPTQNKVHLSLRRNNYTFLWNVTLILRVVYHTAKATYLMSEGTIYAMCLITILITRWDVSGSDSAPKVTVIDWSMIDWSHCTFAWR